LLGENGPFRGEASAVATWRRDLNDHIDNDSAARPILRTTLAELAAGTPLLDGLSVRYLRDIGMYVYESPSGEARAAVGYPAPDRVVVPERLLEWAVTGDHNRTISPAQPYHYLRVMMIGVHWADVC
jgi:hypothetical protein